MSLEYHEMKRIKEELEKLTDNQNRENIRQILKILEIHKNTDYFKNLIRCFLPWPRSNNVIHLSDENSLICHNELTLFTDHINIEILDLYLDQIKKEIEKNRPFEICYFCSGKIDNKIKNDKTSSFCTQYTQKSTMQFRRTTMQISM